MYVARVGDKYLIKRMPDSGSLHDPSCESYEPPAEVSGLGELVGSAIQEAVESGITTLKFDFSLSKKKARAAPSAGGSVKQSVRTDGSKLTLRGCLHYLWEQAGLSTWTPAMTGKRSWGVVRRALLQAAESKTAKGISLNETLFVPEPFYVESKDEILARRFAQLSSLATSTNGTRKLQILVGEVKEVAPARFGHKITVKHLPDFPFMMADDLHQRLQKRFANEIELWSSDESTHLITIATFGLSPGGAAVLEEMSLMLVSANWIPVDDHYDRQLVETLTSQHRRFSKCLRYNLACERPLASAVLVDTVPIAVALYLLPAEVEEPYRAALQSLIDGSELAAWLWKTGEEALAALPPTHGYAPPAIDLLDGGTIEDEVGQTPCDPGEEEEEEAGLDGAADPGSDVPELEEAGAQIACAENDWSGSRADGLECSRVQT